MIYRFLILSDEVDNFSREITIDSEATFLDLQNVILDSVNYTKDQITSFFICDEDWGKKTEISLIEMDTSSDVDSWVMDRTRLSELLDEEKQRLLFVFDNLTERAFFMELREMIPGKNLEKPVCIKTVGQAPAQTISFDDFEKNNTGADLLDESFYGDEEFDPAELDEEGFNDMDMSNDDSFNDRY